jgi:hypothetical protein
MSDWSPEPEKRVLALFSDRRSPAHVPLRVPLLRDGGLLGAICAPPDGIWAWMAGSHMSPQMPRQEFRSQYTDTMD